MQASSSIGRAAVSKTAGWGFDSLLACHFFNIRIHKLIPMESKAVQSKSRFDVVKWLVVFMLIALGVVGNQYFSAESVLYRVLALVGLAIVAALIALQTVRGRRFATLLKEARVEIRKVVWPTRPELVQTTVIVVVFVLVVSLLLWGMDSIISLLVAGFIG